MENVRAIPEGQAIPGWRLIISDVGRFWALRQKPFPLEAVWAGADPAVDADTFAEVQAAVDRQEEIARRVTS
ncbi:hypothetical protein [Streptosporangium carneum]|uniref:Uncharacterized protein n=1 Tax=Streptosporangium carneum TaxID=47481 RepID=A0A9W6MEW6_9ACTN|nr:hypothetical protein [Streptosporangium carneum]GLK11248.1 hypothetical protein GCM10017600_46540 [Streptosporangium carneum]